MREGSRLVFLSHTAEMRRFPRGYSYVDAAEAAVKRAKLLATDMEWFTARDELPSSYCQDQVRQADVFVGIIGFRYGTPVPDQPETSYTELEFRTATQCRIPRFMFLLDEHAELPLPASQLFDGEHGHRQLAFRRHVEEVAGVLVKRFASPLELELRVYQALVEHVQLRRERDRYGGLERVHDQFDDRLFLRYLEPARQVTILNTWIPNMAELRDGLIAAIGRGADVQILMLHPASPVAEWRDRALREGGVTGLDGDVERGVRRCFGILQSIARRLDADERSRLTVRVYNSLPSVAVYRADEHCLFSLFMHGQLAIRSPQFEVEGSDTVLAQYVQRECRNLWTIGKPVDPLSWESDLDRITW
jgi:hypothetical protein